MKIIDILNTGKITVSCELFPPKHGAGLAGAQNIVRETAALHPSFMSITYGAGGGTSEHTVNLACEAQKHGIPALAHLTCISSDQNIIRNVLTQLKQNNIENILALRGDIPEGQTVSAQYKHASDLINEIKTFGDFCIGGACYPEGHPESENLERDIEALKIKVDCGCSFLTTQMFFDNSILYNYMNLLVQKKINVPIVAGIMPVIDGKLITRICKLSGTVLPKRFVKITEKYSDNVAAMKQAGIAYACEQIIDLIANDVRHIHIYTMNKPDIAGKIMSNLSDIFV